MHSFPQETIQDQHRPVSSRKIAVIMSNPTGVIVKKDQIKSGEEEKNKKRNSCKGKCRRIATAENQMRRGREKEITNQLDHFLLPVVFGNSTYSLLVFFFLIIIKYGKYHYYCNSSCINKNEFSLCSTRHFFFLLLQEIHTYRAFDKLKFIKHLSVLLSSTITRTDNNS